MITIPIWAIFLACAVSTLCGWLAGSSHRAPHAMPVRSYSWDELVALCPEVHPPGARCGYCNPDYNNTPTYLVERLALLNQRHG